MSLRFALVAAVPLCLVFNSDCLADRAGQSRWLQAKEDTAKAERSGGRGFFSNFLERREKVRDLKREEARDEATGARTQGRATGTGESELIAQKGKPVATATSSAGSGRPVDAAPQKAERAEGSNEEEALRWKQSSLGKRGGSRTREQRTRVELKPLFGN